MTITPFPNLGFRRLQSRILVMFLFLLIVVQVGGFLVVNTVGINAAYKSASENVAAGARIFHRLLEQDSERLALGARVLTLDYAFREAIGTGDRETVASVLANHGDRVGAAVMMLVDLDRRVVADTFGSENGEPFAYPDLLSKAQNAEQASDVVLMHDQLYQLVIVPVLSPLPVAWVAVGFSINDTLAEDVRRLTKLQVSFLSKRDGDPWRVRASTLPDADRALLSRDLEANRYAGSEVEGDAVFGDDIVTRIVPLSSHAGTMIVAALQEPLSSALEPFRRLQRQLALITVIGGIVSIIVSMVIARGIARPVRDLARVARRIAAGDYSPVPPALRSDEIGDLATAFRAMQGAISTREARITDLAYRDALTGLPNRALCTDRLDQALAAAAGAGAPVAVLLLSLDGFKYVNDTLGYAIGDEVLREVALRLQNVVSDPADTVARQGGDEFVVVLSGCSVDDATRKAAAMLDALAAPMTIEGHIVDIRASIGIAVYPDHGQAGAALLRNADVAMYAAKRDKLGIATWDTQYDRNSVARLSLMSDLRRAVENSEFTLYYQPMVAFGRSGVHHVEALIRWRHPTRGPVPPTEFIPFAEHTGYVRAITQWVLREAFRQCTAWHRDGLALKVSINISARDVMDAELPDKLAALLAQSNCVADWISLEITEGGILDDPARAIRNLERLRALGCRLAIDDFGTGYSSLAYLRQLPVSVLKIDKSFVSGMAHNASDAAIVRSTIDLAHNMGLAVVAEGIEDEATFEQLRTMGCDIAQGYWISRPLLAHDIPAFVQAVAERPMRVVV